MTKGGLNKHFLPETQCVQWEKKRLGKVKVGLREREREWESNLISWAEDIALCPEYWPLYTYVTPLLLSVAGFSSKGLNKIYILADFFRFIPRSSTYILFNKQPTKYGCNNVLRPFTFPVEDFFYLLYKTPWITKQSNEI